MKIEKQQAFQIFDMTFIVNKIILCRKKILLVINVATQILFESLIL